MTVRLPELYKMQYDCFYGDSRFAITEATTKSGKSVGAIHWIITESLRDPEKRASLWLSPAYAHCQAMFDRLERWLTASDPEKTIWKSNKSDLWISLNGAKVFFKGADNYDAIYGTDYGRAVLDEASRMREEAYAAAYSTLTATMGKMRIIGNVKGRKNWAYKLARQAQAGKSGWGFHKLTAVDAIAGGVMQQQALDDAKLNLPDSVYKELFFAEATEDGSNPFRLDCIAKCIKPISKLEPVCFGIDLARKHDFTVAIGLDEHGDICRVMRINHVDWEVIHQKLIETIGSTLAYADATGGGDPVVERLSRVCDGVREFIFTSQTKQQIMGGLAVAIQQQKVSVLDGIIRSELEAFEYTVTPSGNVRYSAPEGEHDDCVCALAMAVAAYDIYVTSPQAFIHTHNELAKIDKDADESEQPRRRTREDILNDESSWTTIGGDHDW